MGVCQEVIVIGTYHFQSKCLAVCNAQFLIFLVATSRSDVKAFICWFNVFLQDFEHSSTP